MVSVEEYLRMKSKPNCDYIDGVVLPKPWSIWAHGSCQTRVAISIETQFRDFQPCIELTCKIREGMYLVPDVAVMHRDRIQDPYPTAPVHLCVEILSPENRFSAMLRKCEQYHDWGVETTWIIDPEFRQAWEYRKGRRPTEIPSSGCLTADGISISLSEVFANL